MGTNYRVLILDLLRDPKGITLSVLLSYSVVKEPTASKERAILPIPSVRVKRKNFARREALEPLPSDADTPTALVFSGLERSNYRVCRERRV